MMKDLQVLKAGVFTVGYQNGFIRHIHYGDVEVVRSIYMALRDQNWFTYEHTIENESIKEHKDHFEIQYDCYYEVKQIRIFKWKVKIKGTLVIPASASFWANRFVRCTISYKN